MLSVPKSDKTGIAEGQLSLDIGDLVSACTTEAIFLRKSKRCRKVTSDKPKIHVDPKARSSFFKPRPVPYALRARVEGRAKEIGGSRHYRTCDSL